MRKPRIFISYRREDSAFQTTAIHSQLVGEFGTENVFMDVDNIPAGRDFRRHLQLAIQECDVCVAVIGDQWLSASAAPGQRRLDNDLDFIRIELEAALQRDIPVIPLLVGRQPMPAPDQLPPSLAELAYRQALTVRPGRDFRTDIQLLVAQVKDIQAVPIEVEASNRASGAKLLRTGRAHSRAIVSSLFAFGDRVLNGAWRRLSAMALPWIMAVIAVAGLVAALFSSALSGGANAWTYSNWMLPLRLVLNSCLVGWLWMRLRRFMDLAAGKLPTHVRSLLAGGLACLCMFVVLHADINQLFSVPFWAQLHERLIPLCIAISSCFLGVALSKRGWNISSSGIVAIGVLLISAWAASPMIKLQTLPTDLIMLGGGYLIYIKQSKVPVTIREEMSLFRRWWWSVARSLPPALLGYFAVAMWSSWRWGYAATAYSVWLVSIGIGLLFIGLASRTIYNLLAKTSLRSAADSTWIMSHVASAATIVIIWIVSEAIIAVQPENSKGFDLDFVLMWLGAMSFYLIAGYIAGMFGLVISLAWGAAGIRKRSERARRIIGALAVIGGAVVYWTRRDYSSQLVPQVLIHVSWGLIAYWSLAMFSITPRASRINSDAIGDSDMPPPKLRLRCPSCETLLSASKASIGTRVRCPKCGTTMTLGKDAPFVSGGSKKSSDSPPPDSPRAHSSERGTPS